MNELQTITAALNTAIEKGAFSNMAQVVNLYSAVQSIALKLNELEKIKQNGHSSSSSN